MFLPLTQRAVRAWLLSTVPRGQKSTSAATVWLLVVSMATGPVAVASPAPSQEVLFRKLVTRALNLANAETQLLPGQLPKSLPVDLPLPPQAQIIGSLIRTKDQRSDQIYPRSVQIYLDVPNTPEQVQSFYQQRLQVLGWSKQELPLLGSRGFASTIVGMPQLFCQGTEGPSLQLTATAIATALTDVRLTFNLEPENNLCSSHYAKLFVDRSPLPILLPPPQTQVRPFGGNSSNQVYYSSANLETQLSPQSLAQHYEKQLEQAGWRQQSRGQSGGPYWSRWQWQDNNKRSWQAYLLLIKAETTPKQYFASLTAFQP